MNTSLPHTIDIDHIVLTDVGMAPGRAPDLRALIEAELPRLLGPRFPATPADTAIVVAPLQVTGPGERPLAAGIARGIVQALAGGGR
jgi:hypothetical protein